QEIQEETLLLINQKYRIMKKFMYVLGIIAPSLLLGSLFIKWQHLPGAGLLITFGLFLLGVIFIPVYVMVKIRDTRENKKKVNTSLYIIGMITGILFLAAALFKIQHIPGGGILIIISTATALVAFLPAMILNVIRDKENQLQSFSNLVFALCFFALMFMLISMTVGKDVLNAFVLTGVGTENTKSALKSRNIAQMNKIEASNNIAESLVANLKELRTRTVTLNEYIQSLRIEILVLTNKKNSDAIDDNQNIDLTRLVDLNNMNAPVEIMIGPYNDGKGFDLQNEIIAYREYLNGLVDAGQDEMINKLLDTSAPARDWINSWPAEQFEHLPMIAVQNNLAKIQSNILIAENEAMQALMRAEPALIASE
ncbi:MAG: hypothetical protein KAR20_01185, partial [Candidatus Heimdallarchaeota archaeon]|nr:hypothetical protein [Candidatus Heimdallarchaeota archaeon]